MGILLSALGRRGRISLLQLDLAMVPINRCAKCSIRGHIMRLLMSKHVPGLQDSVPAHHRHAKSVQTDDSNAMPANPQTAANLQVGCTEGAARNGGRR